MKRNCQWIYCALSGGSCGAPLKKNNKTIYCPNHQKVYVEMVDYLKHYMRINEDKG